MAEGTGTAKKKAAAKTDAGVPVGEVSEALAATGFSLGGLFKSLGRSVIEQMWMLKFALVPKATVFMARKINLGNFENVDFSFSIQVPMVPMEPEELAFFNEVATRSLQEGLNIVKPEVNARAVNILRQLGRLPAETESAGE